MTDTECFVIYDWMKDVGSSVHAQLLLQLFVYSRFFAVAIISLMKALCPGRKKERRRASMLSNPNPNSSAVSKGDRQSTTSWYSILARTRNAGRKDSRRGPAVAVVAKDPEIGTWLVVKDLLHTGFFYCPT
jgi:hypothetical protein